MAPVVNEHHASMMGDRDAARRAHDVRSTICTGHAKQPRCPATALCVAPPPPPFPPRVQRRLHRPPLHGQDLQGHQRPAHELQAGLQVGDTHTVCGGLAACLAGCAAPAVTCEPGRHCCGSGVWGAASGCAAVDAAAHVPPRTRARCGRRVCSGTYTCQENSFDRSMCPGAGVQTVFVALGERCGYMQDNKQYACGAWRRRLMQSWVATCCVSNRVNAPVCLVRCAWCALLQVATRSAAPTASARPPTPRQRTPAAVAEWPQRVARRGTTLATTPHNERSAPQQR
jgi:hypothetical protein